MMEFYPKPIDGFQSLNIITKNSITDVLQGPNYVFEPAKLSVQSE